METSSTKPTSSRTTRHEPDETLFCYMCGDVLSHRQLITVIWTSGDGEPFPVLIGSGECLVRLAIVMEVHNVSGEPHSLIDKYRRGLRVVNEERKN